MSSRSALRNRRKRSPKTVHATERRLTHQTLERRELLAGELGPQLISVSANSGENFRLTQQNILRESPTQLTFRFDGAQQIDPATLAAITIERSGGDGSFNEGNEIRITPGFLGFGDSSRIVIARFAETLPDDTYQISIAGFDDTNQGIVGLRNSNGELLRVAGATNPLRPEQQLQFRVELGPQVVAIVPQPITRIGASRQQQRNQIEVFFNQDPLSNPASGVITTATSSAAVVQPKYYNLFLTGNTVENTDDGPAIIPSSVSYNPALNRAVLTFSSDLSSFASATGGAGTFRLRVGSSQPLPAAPTLIEPELSGDVSGLFTTARDLGQTFDALPQSVIISGQIEPTANYPVIWPGAETAALGSRQREQQLIGQPDSISGINTFHYNFADIYGRDPAGNLLENAITDVQRQRVREALALYSQHLGVQFIETADRGLQFVTGDLRPLVVSAITGTGQALHEFRVDDTDPGRGVLILNAAENWFDGYGLSPDQTNSPAYFTELLRGIGSLLGIGNTFEQVPGVASGSNPALYNASLFPLPGGALPSPFSIEPDFLSASDIIPGLALHRPEIRDVDMYRFDVAADGRISIETFAQRLDETSLLDTDIKLWKFNTGTGEYDLVARNDDYYSNDSFIGIDVSPNADGTPARYYVGITASGNDSYNPLIENSGMGGRSQGDYQMRVTFQNLNVDTIKDVNGSALDGNGDGTPGGDFNFWFRTAKQKVDALSGEARTLFVDKSGVNTSGNGDLLTPYRTIEYAFSQARPGDIVRILPNSGADGRIDTVGDNQAYEIGRGGPSNAVLSDGETFNVPRGVTVMIDAGTIIKLRNAKISVGSSRVDDDRSLAALQVLGTPVLVNSVNSVVNGRVVFTSYQDESFGVDTNSLPTTPAPGQWAGIEFRNDFDYSEGRPVWETEGIFLDYVAHADIRFGGGSIAANEPVVTPLQMLESRPTIIHNTIQFSSDAAISADPNSFAETNFHAPVFQRALLGREVPSPVAGDPPVPAEFFTSDYDRVGPDIRGNRLVNNSINGLFVRVRTPAAGEREPMTVSGRFDDFDITHVISEVLVLQGQPGGPFLLEDRPDVLNVTYNVSPPVVVGSLPVGQSIHYRVTFVTRDGIESLASQETDPVTVGSNRNILLQNLPEAPPEFAGRRLYRFNPDPVINDYEFVRQLDRNSTTALDTGLKRGGGLSEFAIAATSDERLLPRFDARLSIDPGLVIKMDTARIETGVGADFYAEGIDGKPVVFTSRLDDEYGAGGTFDTNNDGTAGIAVPGAWSGLVFRQGSSASLDHAVIRYAGGNSSISGGFAAFNPIEILQADVRVANSILSDNAAGSVGNLDFRDGVGFNGPATIFVRGSQPTIVNNIIRDNLGAAISINPDSLNFQEVQDRGRGTGNVDRFEDRKDNRGALIAGNRLDGNGINGMLIRNESLTTESVWDDTDIVHVVERFVYAWNHHHRSGLRLKSDPGQSLVVKMQDGGAIIADRYLNDLENAIGGTIQVIGQPGFPVILTSIHDDAVGAGFTPAGLPQNDTDNATTDASPGDWYGIVLRGGANDRNVAMVLENEPAISESAGINAIPGTAQLIGRLAASETSSDENVRLGFNVRGTLSLNSDVDVYRFFAFGQTEVYLDIDDTDFGLDSVVELIDINGKILALSNSSYAEALNRNLPLPLSPSLRPPIDVTALPLLKTGQRAIEGPNTLDAGMRVVLPGNSTTENQYFVRVRSSNLGPNDTVNPVDRLWNNAFVKAGLSSGQYQLSIRLGEADEIAGSTIRLADIRFATHAIDVPASPFNSPLAAEFSERLLANGLNINPGTNNVLFASAATTDLGNLLASHQGTLRVSGVLGNNVTSPQLTAAEEDLDVYRIEVRDTSTTPRVTSFEPRFVSVSFDIDYADQLGGPNTRLSVYNAAGQLVAHGLNSNIADDQGRPRLGNDMANLSAGSAGTLDASIGPVSLPEGVYFVVVSSAKMIPEPLAQLANPGAPSTGTRIIPNSSIRRIAEQNFEDGFLFGSTTHVGGFNPYFGSPFVNFKSSGDVPTVTPLFDDTSIVPYTLEDVRMFVTVQGGITGGNQTALLSVDPFTGQLERAIGDFGATVGDLGIRRDGELFSYSRPTGGAQNPGATGNYLNISAGNGTVLSSVDDSINFRRSNQDFNNTEVDPDAVLLVNAMSYQHPGSFAHSPYSTSFPGLNGGSGTLTVVGNRSNRGRGAEVPVELQNNLIFSMMETSGLVTNTGNPNTNANRGFPANVRYTPGFGPASDRFEHGVLDVGQFVDSDPQKTGGTVNGLAQQLFSSQFYAVTSAGGVYRFTTGNTRQPVDPLTGLAQFPYSRVINSTFLGTVQRDPLHSPGNSTPPNFSSLTFGPQFTEDGRYSDVLFATTTDGWIYTLREGASGAIEPAGVLVHGRSAIPIITGTGSTAAFGQITGVAFSTREENPWHQSDRRNGGSEAHGTFPNVDQTQGRVTGGASLYFGFANGGIVNNDGAGGNQSPGGAHGSSVSTPFSLENYGADDAPTLYFSYFLDVENNNQSQTSPSSNPADQAVDALRVFAVGDDGQWQLLATNNTFRGAGVIDEFDYFNQTGIPVQPLHDNTNTWRQARIDLSPLAGNKNVQLRFDFSTAGGMQSQFRTSGFLTEIQTTPGVEVIPGSTFTLSRSLNTPLSNAVASPQPLTTFEFVRGVAINIPAGNAILDGQQISITGSAGTVDVTLTTVGTGDPNEVVFDRADTAAMVADKIVAVLLALDPASTTVAVGSQLQDSEALAFNLTPERFGVLEIEMPANPLALDGQSLTLINAIGATSTIRLESIQDVDFSVGFQSINVTADIPGSADGVTILFRDTVTIGNNLPFATFSNAQRRITVFYNSAAATVTNRDFDAIVAAIDALADFTATLSGGVGTTPFTPPAIQPAFPTDEVYILGTDTADSIADKLAVRINSLDQGFAATATDDQLTILGAGARVLGASFNEIAFNQGGHASQLLPSGNVPIFYHWGMTAGEVREAIRTALVNGLGTRDADSGVTAASIEHYPGFATNRIRVFEQSLLGNTSTLGFSTFLPGDEFGSFASQFVAGSQINPRPGMNNIMEGVVIDDIIIGFAERGELVTNAPVDNPRFVIDPQYNRTTTAEYPNEILVGGYTLEIRQSPDYAVPNDFNATRRPPSPRSTGGVVNQRDEQFGLGRAFDTNDRFDNAVTLIAPDASQINDGDTFVISNGTRQLTFEFDTNSSVAAGRVRVPFQKNLPDGRPFPAHDVATSIRDAINSTQSRNILGIVAAGIDGTETGPSTATRINLFGSSVVINPSGGQFLKVDLVAAETKYGRETARTLPTVDQTNRQATNDTIGSASDIGLANPVNTAYRNGNTDTLIVVGKVGDAVYTDYTNSVFNDWVFGFGGYRPDNDVDAVRIYLNAGDGIDAFAQVVGLNLGSVLTPLVQIFDADTLAFEAGNVDGVTGFFAPRSGFYVVAVSSAGGFGEYQLTIRPTNRPLQPNQTDALVARYFLEPGDANVFRPQGQLIIESNFISDFAQTGIRATYTGDEIPGAAAASTLERHPGGVALLRNPNTGRLVPGTVIVNNVVTATQGTGIVYSGVTPASGSSPAPVPFGRIVNNTVVGSGSGVGVQIANSTSPTVLNNVFSGFATGLSIDASSVSTIENGNAFQGTTVASTRLPLASQSFVVPSGVALFQDPDRRLYIPAAGSQIIDSSFGNLNDRAAFFNTVKQPVGITASPILAPIFDAYGIPRVDDPTVTTPGGVGGTVFIDRGGIDRSDQVQPTAVLVSPIDWISGQGVQVAGGDTDRDASFVRLPRDSGPVAFFEIQLLDPAGTGPDVTTITADTVILTENGVTLIPGVDYTFGYSDNSRLIRLTPLSGLWRPDAVYEVTLNNKDRVGLTLPRGDAITDGDRYIVTDAQGRRSVLEFDSGYVMQVPQTLGIEVLGPNTFFNDGDIFTIRAFDGTFRTFEINLIGAVASGNIPINLASAGTVDQIRDTILNAVNSVAGPLNLAPQSLGSDSLQIGSVLGHTITGTVAGLDFFGVARGVSSGQQFRFQTATDNLLFEFTDGSGPVAPDAIAINVTRTDTNDEIAAAIAVAIQTELGALSAAQSIGDGRVSINGTATDLLTVANSALTLLGRPGVTGPLELVVPQSATAAALDTLTFGVQNGLVTVTFQFTTNPQLVTANRRVVLSDTDTPAQIAAIIAAEIDAAFTGALNPSATGNVVLLGEQLAIIPEGTSQVLARIDVGVSSLLSRGVSGGAIPVPFIPTSQFAPALAAASFAGALEVSPLQVTFFSPGGGTLLLDNIVSIDFLDTAGNVSVAGQLRPAITDLAGNPIESNRDNAETRFTIIMPEVEFDFGDAPNSYGTTSAQNGARHSVGADAMPRLGRIVDTEANGQPFPLSDDSLTPVFVDSPNSSPLFTFVAAPMGGVDIAISSNFSVVGPTSGDSIRVQIGDRTATFELVQAGVASLTGNIPVPLIAGVDTPESIAEKIAVAIRAALAPVGRSVVVTVDPINPVIRIESLDDEDGIAIGQINLGIQSYFVFLDPSANINNPTPNDVLGFLNPLDPAGTTIAVTVTGAGLLDAWVDFDGDGEFDPSREQILQNRPVVDGVNLLNIVTPANAVPGTTWVRFRLSTTGNLRPTGSAVGGEVEDYRISIIPVAPFEPRDDVYNIDEDMTLVVTPSSPFSTLMDNDVNLSSPFLPPRVFIVDQPRHGTVTITDPLDGSFDYVPDPAFNGTDFFTYRLSSEGAAAASAPSAIIATVTINVAPVNDAPVFNSTSPVELLERDDLQTVTVNGVISGALPGRPEATDEIASQTISISINTAASTIPAGLFQSMPVVVPTTDDNGVVIGGDLQFVQNVDAFGTALLVINVVDDHPIDPQTTTVTITVNIRPVNDAPRLNPAVLGIADTLSPDNAYSVAAGPGPGAGTILYTSAEDQTLFIPLRRPTGVLGFNRIGLLDVFTVGPNNETLAVDGGNQVLELESIPPSTSAGGTLTPVLNSSDVLIGFNYQPPQDFNETFGGLDSFIYSVIDDNPLGGESWDLDVGGLVDDRRTTSGLVQLRVNRVNDAPQFNMLTNTINVLEDSPQYRLPGFAFNIFAGPPATAFDENDPVTGQTVSFAISGLTQATNQMFASAPTVSPAGVLTFTPAPNAFGSVILEVRATDNGPDNAIRGDVVSSPAQLLTINIRPVNDRPVLNTTTPIVFTLNEDAAILLSDNTLGPPQGTVIPLRGTGGVVGLLDVFSPGPPNESADLEGGRQTIRLATPIPASTAQGGTLTRVFDQANPSILIGLRYTPRPNFNGIDSFIYGVRDDGETSDLNGNLTPDPRESFHTVTLNVVALNDPPQFSGPLSVTVNEDATTTAVVGETIIANFVTDIAAGPPGATDELHPMTGQTVSFVVTPLAGNPSNLFVELGPTVSSNGTLTFRTVQDANGVAVFTIFAEDTGDNNPPLESNSSAPPRTFTITVNPINDPPTFVTDPALTQIEVPEDFGPFTTLVPLATQISPGPADEVAAGQTVRFEVTVPVAGQALFQTQPNVTDNGFFRFTPRDNAVGQTVVSIVAIDSEGARSEPALVTITITEVNDTPVAGNVSFNSNENTVLSIAAQTLLDAALDPDLATNPNEVLRLTAVATISQSGAQIRVLPSGNIEYDPRGAASIQALRPGQTLADTFTYRVIDATDALSNLATVTVNVAGINDAPTVIDDFVTLGLSGPITIRPLDNDFDVDGTINPLTLQITQLPAFGSVEVRDGSLIYTPFQNFRGTDSIRYRVADDLGAFSESASITIDTNVAPVANNDNAGTVRGRAVEINVAQNDFDPDGQLDLNSIVIITPPARGEAIVLGGGIVRYLPGSDFVGIETFTYTIRDTRGRPSNVGQVRVQVVASDLQNPSNFTDVNASGETSPIDALLILTRLSQWNREGNTGSMPIEAAIGETPRQFYDVDGNRFIEPVDALSVINEIARRNRVEIGEGEQVAANQPLAGPNVAVPTVVTTNEKAVATTRADDFESVYGPVLAPAGIAALAADFALPEDGIINTLAIDIAKEETEKRRSEWLEAIDAAWTDASQF